jgi:pimeloyl-ACP methyl ester carboxylesterase
MSTPLFLELPPGVSALTVRTPRGDFRALEAGARTGPTAVLVPGFTGSKEDFIAVLGPLGRAGFHVVAFDQRGQYQTPGPASAEGWTLEGFGADAVAIARATSDGTRVHLLGHSFGGIVARAAVLADPETFRSLVLLGSGPAALPQAQAVLLRTFSDAIEAFDLATVFELKRAYDLEAGWVPPSDPAIDTFVRDKFLGSDPGCLAAMARILSSEPDRTDQLAAAARSAHLAVLVAWGEDDDAWSPQIQAETASRLGARAVSLPEAAHSPAVETPGETARVLAQFWATAEDPG